MRVGPAGAFAIFLVLPLVLLELGARRLLKPRQAGLLQHRPISDLYHNLPQPETIFEEVSSASLEWAPYEHFAMRPGLTGRHYSTNDAGLRGAEIAVAKPEGVYRIAVLGGSAAWGYGSSSNETTVPGNLQTWLQKARPDLAVEVLNAGQPGYVSTQELIFFHRVVSRFEPDLVLLFDGYNDIVADMINGSSGLPQNAAALRSRYEGSFAGKPTVSDAARWLRRSRFLDAVADRALAGRSAELTFPSSEETAGAYVRNVRGIARLAAPALVAVALQPSLASTTKPLAPQELQMLAEKERAFPGYSDFVRSCYHALGAGLALAGVERIELAGALGNDDRLLFADECHFGDQAAEMLAAALAQRLAEKLPPTTP